MDRSRQKHFLLSGSGRPGRFPWHTVQQHLDGIGLTLSAEKTKMTKFLGFDISAWSVTMRAKSVEKYKAKIRELTPRHHNLNQEVVAKVNAVIRGTANYFATAVGAGLALWMAGYGCVSVP
jgi:hypothetical protein